MLNKIRKALGYLLYVSTSFLPHYQLHYSWPITTFLRRSACKMMLDSCGKKVDIGRRISFSKNVSLGDKSSIGDNSYLVGEIVIGKDVMMAANCALIASNHKFDRLDIPMNRQGGVNAPIVIEDNVWIGYGVTILAGVTVHSGAVLAAGSVVSKDVPGNAIVGGVPARVIKFRGNNEGCDNK